MRDLTSQLIQVTHYQLVQPREACIEAIQALADRTEQEGHPGVLGYQFFTDSGNETAGAIITYSGADAWMAHHQLAYQWEEMSRLQATVKLQNLALFGPLNDEVNAWITKAGLSYTHYDQLAAGFVRG